MKKKLGLIVALVTTVLLLSGCSAAETEGHWFHDYIVHPFILSIKVIGNFFNSYGLAVIVITIILRTILLPFALNTAKKQKVMREKMEIMKPEMEEIQKKIKNAKTKEDQMKAQQEMMQLYQKHNFNPLAMGCLPMLLQIPIWLGLYWAIRLSDEIAHSSFLWFNLGQVDYIMAVLAGISYYFQFKVSMMNSPMPVEQQQQMKLMGLLSPIMILIASITMPSALALYWFVSGFYLIGQTYLTKVLYGTSPAPASATAATGTTTNTSNKNKKK